MGAQLAQRAAGECVAGFRDEGERKADRAVGDHCSHPGQELARRVAEVEGRWRETKEKSKDTLWGGELGEAQALPGGARLTEGLWCSVAYWLTSECSSTVNLDGEGAPEENL